MLPFLYYQSMIKFKLYSDSKIHLHMVTGVGSSKTQDKNKMAMAEHSKEAFSYKDVTVHFVGAWYMMHKLLF